jgi:hypothetical protein
MKALAFLSPSVNHMVAGIFNQSLKHSATIDKFILGGHKNLGENKRKNWPLKILKQLCWVPIILSKEDVLRIHCPKIFFLFSVKKKMNFNKLENNTTVVVLIFSSSRPLIFCFSWYSDE